MGRTERPIGTVSGIRSSGYVRVSTDPREVLPHPGGSGNPPPPDCPSFFGDSPECLENIFPYPGLLNFITIVSILEVILFIVTLVVGQEYYDGAFVKGNRMAGPSATTLKAMGGKWEPDIYMGHIYLLISPIFLHAGIIHIVGNLLFQLRFGWVAEKRWGWWRVAVIYILSGMGGCLLSAYASPTVVGVGASGALFGLFGASIVFLILNWDVIPSHISEAIYIGILLLLEVAMGFGGSGVDHFAHLGGFVTGVAMGFFVPTIYYQRENQSMIKWIGIVTTLLLFTGLCLMVWLGHR